MASVLPRICRLAALRTSVIRRSCVHSASRVVCFPDARQVVRWQFQPFSASSCLNKSTSAASSSSAEDTPSKEATGPPLVLSDSCIKRLQEILKDDHFLRVNVEGGGCSGFQYVFSVDKELKEDDVVIEQDKAKVVIDETSLEYVRGSTIDYHQELIRSAFRILGNPQAEQGCSCGASFSVKF